MHFVKPVLSYKQIVKKGGLDKIVISCIIYNRGSENE